MGGTLLGTSNKGNPFNHRKNGKNIDKDDEEGYDTSGNSNALPIGGQHEDGHEHKHTHEHIHTHKYENEYVMPLEQLPQPKTPDEVEGSTSHGLESAFVPYGFPVSQPYHQQPVAMQGLPPQFLHVPFGTRKQATAEQIMTIFGELVNEYQNDQTMTMSQVDTLLRQRLKEKFNIE